METKQAKLLYVEDDETLSYITRENLERKGYNIVKCDDGLEAWKVFNEGLFDLCILDVMLPKLDGFSLAKKIRQVNDGIPIIFVTAKSLHEDKIEGLMLGADDYIIKPYSIEELILKIEIFLKRSQVNKTVFESTFFNIGKFRLDYSNLTLHDSNNTIRLTYREAELLKFFINNPDKLLTREFILTSIWGENDYFTGRSLDVFISRLRKHLKNDPTLKFENRHGVGFIFKISNS